MTASDVRHRLVRPAAPAGPPPLDEDQRRVVEHRHGPLLVLAGPGTGKTTTLVEAVVDRVERGARPDEVLTLTFSRQAAEQLRDRITARLGRTTATTACSTFHSFAYQLVRRFAPAELYAAPLRLLSAPEQDVMVAELLADTPESVQWPRPLAAALRTRGFAREVQAVLARARERGMDPEDLIALAKAEQVPELDAAGLFMRQYLDVLGAQSALDHAELVSRAVAVAEVHRERLRSEFSHVFVDEYQDTDPSQVALLQRLGGDGRSLVVVGDPDQSIYGFRGADVRGILDFPRQFPRSDGTPADVVALGTTRRFGATLLRASREVAAGIGVSGSIPAEAFARFRAPAAPPHPLGPGRVEVLTFDTARAEVEHLADLLRRAHLEDGVPWQEMAVLVRSGRATIPALRRSLVAAGVPVEVAGDEVPLVREPAVLALLDALRLVVDAGVEDPTARDHVGPDRIESLMTSPLGGLDATAIRRLARLLRAGASEPASSRVLLRRAVLEPGFARSCLADGAQAPDAVHAVERLASLVARARHALEERQTVEQVLWLLWDGTGWPARLRSGIRAGGQAARLAHRDLDALCALFEVAARTEETKGHTSVASFLATLVAQEIPGDTLAERGVRGRSVRLLTAHRSKGLEWQLVVVAHVQDGSWPDLRRRHTLLHADRISTGGLLPPTSAGALLAEERRLFYVACTRARQRLVVTAVASPEEDGEQPSRFLEELGHPSRHRVGRPPRPLSVAGLVAELRRTLADADQPEALREAAATRLAVLAAAEVHGRRLAPQADPSSWWGLRGVTRADRPLRPTDEPLVISASALEGILRCPAQWFLQREAGGAVPSTASQGFGLVVHALADRIARGELSGDEDLGALVDQVWDRLDFRTPWSGPRERRQLVEALDRFLAWHRRPEARRLLATESPIRAEVTLADGERVRLHGYADRIEIDEDGSVVVVDLKTGKYPSTRAEVDQHPQLGLYHLAVRHGAADHLLGSPATPGASELVQLRKGTELPLVQHQAPQEQDAGGSTLIETQLQAATSVLRSEALVARPGSHCERCPFTALCPDKTAGSVLA